MLLNKTFAFKAYTPQILLLCTWHQEHSRSHHQQILGNPAGRKHQFLCSIVATFDQFSVSGIRILKALINIQYRALQAVSYVKVPESKNSDHHAGRGPAFAVGAVENEG